MTKRTLFPQFQFDPEAWTGHGMLSLILLAICTLAACDSENTPPASPSGTPGTNSSTASVSEASMRKLCGHCHLFPEPEWLSQEEWRSTIRDMTKIPDFHRFYRDRPDIEQVIEWYVSRAPETLPSPADVSELNLETSSFEVSEIVPGLDSAMTADVIHGRFSPSSETEEILISDMYHGTIHRVHPAAGESTVTEIPTDLNHPARLQICDLDGDGLQDLLVGELGSFLPLDHSLGSVVWLRQASDGMFESIHLADNLGRVVEVQAEDLDNDGDLDLVVGEFGWRITGHLIVLENQTEDWSQPQFRKLILDGRNGIVKVHIADLNDDGRMDIVALIAQGHEMLTAYLNQGNLKFESKILHRAPHPAWGYCDLEACDLDRDGDLDFVLANGDTLDNFQLKPFYSISWLENLGDLKYQAHRIQEMFGVMAIATGDIDGDGDLDIAASAFVSQQDGSVEGTLTLPSLIWLEQTETGLFHPHLLETNNFTRLSLNLFDINHDGREELLIGTGSLVSDPPQPVLEHWKFNP